MRLLPLVGCLLSRNAIASPPEANSTASPTASPTAIPTSSPTKAEATNGTQAFLQRAYQQNWIPAPSCTCCGEGLRAGVVCDETTGELLEFHREAQDLTGTLPPFSLVPKLREMRMSYNSITGTIPSLSLSDSFSYMDFRFNQLSGTVPSFETVPHLQAIILNDNQLEGQFPSLAGQYNIQYLYIENNLFTSTAGEGRL